MNCSLVPHSVANTSSNTCQCTQLGYEVEALSGSTLLACLPSSTTKCPAAYPIALKIAGAAPNIVACITTPSTEFGKTKCPESFPVGYYKFDPPKLQECLTAPPPRDLHCEPPYDLPIVNGSELLGCAMKAYNVCPRDTAAYRAFNSFPPWLPQLCQAYDMYRMCKLRSSFEVSASNVRGGTDACLALDPSPDKQACPTVPGAIFPVTIVQASPLGCGSYVLPCSSAHIVHCQTVEALCGNYLGPEVSGFTIMGYTTPDGPSVKVGCRASRTACDLVAAAMRPPPGAGADPTAAGDISYTIRLTQGPELVGCIQTGATVCPASHSYATYSSAGELLECNKIGAAIPSCPPTGQPDNTIKVWDTNWLVAQCVRSSEPCPASHPLALRTLQIGKAVIGSPAGCVAHGIQGGDFWQRYFPGFCDVGNGVPFPLFAPGPNEADGGALETRVTSWVQQCYPTQVVQSCNLQVG